LSEDVAGENQHCTKKSYHSWRNVVEINVGAVLPFGFKNWQRWISSRQKNITDTVSSEIFAFAFIVGEDKGEDEEDTENSDPGL
jgi:hypothetical protein